MNGSGFCPPAPGPPRPHAPGYFLYGQKVTKKPLKELRSLRIFLNDGGISLRYDLFVSFSQCLLWADGSLCAAAPLPFSLLRWVRLLEARFFGETTGPPAQCGRYCPAIRRTPFVGADIIRPLFRRPPHHHQTFRRGAHCAPARQPYFHRRSPQPCDKNGYLP